jgi:hypothetical protein
VARGGTDLTILVMSAFIRSVSALASAWWPVSMPSWPISV